MCELEFLPLVKMHFKSKRLVQCWIFILDVGSPVFPIFCDQTSINQPQLIVCYAAVVPEGSECFGIMVFLSLEERKSILDVWIILFRQFLTLQPFSFCSSVTSNFYIVYCSRTGYPWICSTIIPYTILHLHVLEYFFWTRHPLDPPFCAGWGIALIS